MAGALVDAASLPDLARGIDGLSQNPPPTPRYAAEELAPKSVILDHPDSPTEPRKPITTPDTIPQATPKADPVPPSTPKRRKSFGEVLKRLSRSSEKAPPIPVEPVPVLPPPTRNPWQASAARPGQQPKKNKGEGQKAAAAAKALAGTSRGRQGSSSSLSLNNFPVPGQPFSPTRASPSVKSDSSSEHGMSLAGGITKSTQYQCRSATHTRANSTGQSVRSGGSRTGMVPVGSLGETVGFTFKNTTNFVHPDIPRRKESSASLYQDEPEEAQMDRMNSLTEDGGWQTGWSVSGAQGGMFSASSFGPSTQTDDYGPDDLAPDEGADDAVMEDTLMDDTIIEEEEESPGRPAPIRTPSPPPQLDPFEPDHASLFSWSFGGASRTVSPVRHESPTRIPPPLDEDEDDISPITRTFDVSAHSTPTRRPSVNDASSRLLRGQSLRVLRSRASSLSIGRRAQGDDQSDSSNPCTPVKSSFGNFSLLGRDAEPEDPASRAANIAAARKAFEEKEAAKDRRQAELDAKRELRRKKSDARWRRKPSTAIDSTVDAIEEEGTYTISRSSSRKSAKRSISPDDEYDPLSRVPEQSFSSVEETNFPAYHDQTAPDHSMFSSAYQDRESGVFGNINKGGFFPPIVVAASAQVYEIDGQMYNEYGERIDANGVVQPDPVDDGSEAEERGRRLSKTKVARGQLRKLSAWGKTRMLSRS